MKKRKMLLKCLLIFETEKQQLVAEIQQLKIELQNKQGHQENGDLKLIFSSDV